LIKCAPDKDLLGAESYQVIQRGITLKVVNGWFYAKCDIM
jgi:hypothetical protein